MVNIVYFYQNMIPRVIWITSLHEHLPRIATIFAFAHCEWTLAKASLLEEDAYLPSATKLRRLCFYTCLSVHGGGQPQCMLVYHPREQAPPGTRHPPQDQAPPLPKNRRLLLRTVRILLECILVYWVIPVIKWLDICTPKHLLIKKTMVLK